MAQVDITRIAHGERNLAFVHIGKQRQHLLEMRAALAHRLQDWRNINVRPNIDPGRRIIWPDIRKQKEHEQGALTRPQIYPPLAAYIETTINVPAGVAGVLGTRKADHEQAGIRSWAPSTPPDELVE
jgi:hypothetical protein